MLGAALRAVGVCRAPRKGKRGIGVWRRARAAWLCASPWLCEWAFLACEQVLPIHVSVRFYHAAAYTSARPAPPSTCLTCASVGWSWAGGGVTVTAMLLVLYDSISLPSPS